MQRRRIPNTDLDVSALCCGGAALGTAAKGEAMDTLLNAYRDSGGNFFDTAHCYGFWVEGGDGASERALAGYFRRNGGRQEAVIATKGGHPTQPSYRTVDHYLSPGRIAADIDDSLARLDCQTIDLYWLHRDDTRLPAGEIIETLNAEVARGRIRHLGASNWTTARLAEANAYAKDHGLRPFVAAQPEWSLGNKPGGQDDPSGHGEACRFMAEEDVTWFQSAGMAVVPYSSTARGYFATGGKAAREAFENPITLGRLARAQQLAQTLGKTPNQIALAWLMGHDFPVFPILGTTRIEHLKDALGAADVRLSPPQVAWLRDGTPRP